MTKLYLQWNDLGSVNIFIVFILKCQILPFDLYYAFCFCVYALLLHKFSGHETVETQCYSSSVLFSFIRRHFAWHDPYADRSLWCQELSWEFGMARHQNFCICLHFCLYMYRFCILKESEYRFTVTQHSCTIYALHVNVSMSCIEQNKYRYITNLYKTNIKVASIRNR